MVLVMKVSKSDGNDGMIHAAWSFKDGSNMYFHTSSRLPIACNELHGSLPKQSLSTRMIAQNKYERTLR